MPYIFSGIISANKCTIMDLKNSLYIDECMDLLDIIKTDIYNESVIIDNGKK